MFAPKIKRHVQRKSSGKTCINRKVKVGNIHPGAVLQRHADKMNSAEGNPLSQNTKGFMESRFGTDFSGVRVHTDTNAVQMSEELNVQAFTYGNDIFFNRGKFSPESSPGKHLLAHELTHTLQQTGKIQKKEGEGHDLTSADLQGNSDLEAVFDGEKVLKKKDKGPAVGKVQNALIKLGFTLPVFGADEDFGNETQGAVIKFQAASGLTGVDVDGIVGKKTLGLLDMASRHGASEKDTDKKADDFIIKGKQQDKDPFQVFFELGESKLDSDETKKLDEAAGKILPPKLILKGFASEEGSDSFNRQLIKQRIKGVRDYLGPKLSSRITLEDKPALVEGKGQVHYRQFRSVKLINGDDVKAQDCSTDLKSKKCSNPYDILNKAADNANDMIVKAKAKLPPQTPADTKLVFEELFRPNNPSDQVEKDKIITDIKDILDKMVNHITKLKDDKFHVCATECDGGCQAGSPAYNRDTPNHGDEGVIFICPSFEKETGIQQAIIIIHEGHHGVPKIPSDDVAYRHGRLIKIIDKDQAMQNASSFEFLVKLLLNPKSDQVGPKEKDDLKGGISDNEAKDINEAVAWIEQWFSLLTFDTASHYSNIVKVRNTKSWITDRDTEHAFFEMRDRFAPRFGLTVPPTLPSFEDQKSIAAVNDRCEQMEKPLGSKLEIEKVSTGKDNWEKGPKSKITVTQDFFKLPPSKMVVALLQELVHATPGISASLEPEYVLFINDMRLKRNLGGPKK